MTHENPLQIYVAPQVFNQPYCVGLVTAVFAIMYSPSVSIFNYLTSGKLMFIMYFRQFLYIFVQCDFSLRFWRLKVLSVKLWLHVFCWSKQKESWIQYSEL